MKYIYIIITLFLLGCQSKTSDSSKQKSDFSGKLTQQEIANGRLTPEILWKFGRLGSFDISPDGKQIVYSVTRYDYKTEESTANIFVISAEGGEPQKITEDEFSDIAPVWTDSGNKIAFLSDRYGDYQLWMMNPDGSARQPMTNIAGGINAFKLSPDGKHFLYTKDVKEEKSIEDKYPDLPKANAIEAEDLMYRHWNSWSDHKFSHIFVAELSNKPVTNGIDIMRGEKWDSPLAPYFDDSEISWSPNGKTIAYTCKKLYGKEYAVSTNSDIYLYDIETQKTKNITAFNKGYDKYPVFSPDSKRIAWMSMETPGYESDKERLCVMDLETGDYDVINKDWDQNANSYEWSDDGSGIFFISGHNATYQIYKTDVENKTFVPITYGQHNVTSFEKSGDVIVYSKTTHQMAAELFTISKDGKESQLTQINKDIYDNISMGHTEERWVKTTDNKDMLVWVIYPPDFDKNKKYPALLYCQGGPQSAVSQFFSYRWNFAIMAANDYIIVAPNRRGLPTFGQEWNAQISTDYYGQNIKDYLSAIDALKIEPYIDENRLGCVGASYGGYSVFYLAGHHNKRFKAFISHCGMYNMESFATATEETFFPMHDLGGMPWETDNKVAQKSYAHSPHKFVQNWDTPIMIITGGHDYRIPYTESLQAFNAAQLLGVPSRLLYFPDETHFVTKPQNAILWQREFFDWLDRYLK